MSGLAVSLIASNEVDEAEIERLKQGDIWKAASTSLPSATDAVSRPIDERDRYMAASSRRGAFRANPGARRRGGREPPPACRTTCARKQPSQRGDRRAESAAARRGERGSGALTVFVLGGFARDSCRATTGGEFAALVLLTGIGGAISCIAAAGHPLSVLVAF